MRMVRNVPRFPVDARASISWSKELGHSRSLPDRSAVKDVFCILDPRARGLYTQEPGCYPGHPLFELVVLLRAMRTGVRSFRPAHTRGRAPKEKSGCPSWTLFELRWRKSLQNHPNMNLFRSQMVGHSLYRCKIT